MVDMSSTKSAVNKRLSNGLEGDGAEVRRTTIPVQATDRLARLTVCIDFLGRRSISANVVRLGKLLKGVKKLGHGAGESLPPREPAPMGQPLTDKAVVFDLAGCGSMRAEVEVSALERNDCLSRRLVKTVFGKCRVSFGIMVLPITQRTKTVFTVLVQVIEARCESKKNSASP